MSNKEILYEVSYDLGNSEETVYAIDTSVGEISIRVPARMTMRDASLALCLINTAKADIMNTLLGPLVPIEALPPLNKVTF